MNTQGYSTNTQTRKRNHKAESLLKIKRSTQEEVTRAGLSG
jgi:hypothetical protein